MTRSSALLALALALPAAPAAAALLTGIDMLERTDFEVLRGKRVGLSLSEIGEIPGWPWFTGIFLDGLDLEPGDDVVTFEPYYDSYAACISMAGANRRLAQMNEGSGEAGFIG